MVGTKLGDTDLCRECVYRPIVLDKVCVAGGGASEVARTPMLCSEGQLRRGLCPRVVWLRSRVRGVRLRSVLRLF